jgi:hypothetical protein
MATPIQKDGCDEATENEIDRHKVQTECDFVKQAKEPNRSGQWNRIDMTNHPLARSEQNAGHWNVPECRRLQEEASRVPNPINRWKNAETRVSCPVTNQEQIPAIWPHFSEIRKRRGSVLRLYKRWFDKLPISLDSPTICSAPSRVTLRPGVAHRRRSAAIPKVRQSGPQCGGLALRCRRSS